MAGQVFDIAGRAAFLMEAAIQRVSDLKSRGHSPGLAIVTVGSDPQSAVYVARKMQDCAATGIVVHDYALPDTVAQADLLAQIARLNADPSVDGVMVQLPLPLGFDRDLCLRAVAPEKDVDGLHPDNIRLLSGRTPSIIPCTVRGVDDLLQATDIRISGVRKVILGRGQLVGYPAALLFGGESRGADVSVIHRGTADPAAILRAADIIIAAAGSPGIVQASDVAPGAAVIDIGMTWEAGILRGDVADDVALKAGWVTPPHTSFGPMTRAMLLHNLLDLAERHHPA